MERKWGAIALTEHGNMASIPDLYFATKEFGIKQIIGCELYYNDEHLKFRKIVDAGGTIGDLKKSEDFVIKDLASRITRNRHITILCKNEIGYRNLLQIMKCAWEIGFYYRPRTWFDMLDKHHEGLIILSGCLNGPISFEIREHMRLTREYEMLGDVRYKQKAEEHLLTGIKLFKKFKKTFGDDYYVELQMPGVPDDEEVFAKLHALAIQSKTKEVITGDSHYLERKDFIIQKLMMAVDQNVTIDDPNLFHVNSDEQFFKDRAQFRETFNSKSYRDNCSIEDFERACDNTLEVADKVVPFMLDSEPKYPSIENANEILRKRCHDALKMMKLDKKEYVDRLEFELNRIISKDFASYFLITQDMTNFSRSHGLVIGPGRGSIGGCLVAYLLRIHTVDPLKWGLSFDRFLSPSRGGKMLKVVM
jgi:DNA polymerase-3 subunit alpha